MKKKIAIISNTSWYIFNFRRNLIYSLIESEYEVITIAPADKYSLSLESMGCNHIDIEIDSKSRNPVKDLLLLFNFNKIFKSLQPNVVLNFTAKPNIYASLAAYYCDIPAINNIAGLGMGFVNKNLVSSILKLLYKYSQKRAFKVFFQNPDDQELFYSKKIVGREKSALLPGSGVDLKRFQHYPIPNDQDKEFRFLLVARMLNSKGIPELVSAARILKESGINNFKIQLLGEVGVNNSDAIPIEKLKLWAENNYVEYLGGTDDVIPYMKNAHCVILPSYYREGTPRSLLEALSIGRPIITTEMPGCKETVEANFNGFLVKPKNVHDLEEKMKAMLSLANDKLVEMGNFSRNLAQAKFDEKIVIDKYLISIQESQNNHK